MNFIIKLLFVIIGGILYYISMGIVIWLKMPTDDTKLFTAVIVAWLAKFNPFTMILTAFLIVFLSQGCNQITTALELDSAFGDIITGIILFFIIGSEFFINYKIHFRKSSKKEVA